MFEKSASREKTTDFYPSTTTRGKSDALAELQWMMYNKKRKGFIIFWSTTRGGKVEWRKWISEKKRKGIEK
jgi:hypothetical protein